MSTDTPIYLIDGNAYIYRAYHAIVPLSNKQGLPTHAILGFNNILLRVIREKEPKHLAIAFDAKGPTFRHQMYVEYKSNRPPMPEDLVVQLPYIKELVKAHNIFTIEQSGVEADDLLASMARTLSTQGHQVVIISGDKDLLQLVNDSITLWDPMLDRLMDTAAVLKKYKVAPNLLTDLFALMGDKADNIPGVPGVGPKTAEKLINEYQSVSQLYDNIDSLKRSKLKDNLLQYKDQAFLSKDLVQLKEDIPTPDNIEEYAIREANQERLTELYTELEFTRLLQETRSCQQLDVKGFNLVQSQADLKEMIGQLRQASFLVIDTETTSLDTLTAELVGISLCTTPESAYYLPITHQDEDKELIAGQLTLSAVAEALGEFIKDTKLPKLGHNLKFDYAILAKHGLKLAGPLWDTMIASYLIDPTRRSHKLDTLSEELLNIKMTSFSEATKGNTKTDNFRFTKLEAAKNYSCEDVAATLLLWQRFEPELDALKLWPLFSNVEIPLIPILAEMEHDGVLIDSGALAELSAELGLQLKELDRQIVEIAGSFNINSPKQLAEVLFDKLKLPHGRKTKTGYSTDMKVLEKLAATHELPKLIIEYRNLTKLKSTYVDKLPSMVHPQTGRLHTNFNQTVTATGRLSSSSPNLQNIPIRTPEGQRIRAAFVPAPQHKFISADYSQIDLRVLAHYSRDSALVQAFCSGEDIHRQTAAEIFRITPEFVTNQMRRVAKSINFGIVYGMSAFGLAQQLGIGRKEAATFIDRYFAHYNGVKKFMDEVICQAKKDGFVTTLLGRRRQLPDINSPSKTRREFAERTALNTPIQGTAADIIKLASIKVNQDLKQEGLKSKQLLQIHDELILETPANEAERTSALVKEAMETVLDLAVPLLVNISIADNLAKA